MKIHRVSVEEALASLHTGAGGLSAAEAERRLREFGPNRVERVQRTPLAIRFLKGFTHFFALILWVARWSCCGCLLYAEVQRSACVARIPQVE